jgi:putative endonuclease
MTAARQALGRGVEEQAAAWYVARGYEVVDRNWRCRDPRGELDVVACHRRRRVVVICEVKARRSDRFGTALDAVGFRKQLQLRRLAAHWLRDRGREVGIRGASVRFDVAAWQAGELSIVENAF